MRKTKFLLPIVAMMSLVACSKPEVPDHAEVDPTKTSFNVGILLPAEGIDALDYAAAGFKDALMNNPLIKDIKTIVPFERNAGGDSSSLIAYAKSLVTNCDMLVGVSTGSSIALKNARDEAGRKQPLLFTAVTDPVGDRLMVSLKNHDGSVTGTSDVNPVEAQTNIVADCFNGVKDITEIKFATLYTSSEHNSEVQSDRAIAQAQSLGMQTRVYTCTDSSDLPPVSRTAFEWADVVYIPTDNNIAGNMSTIKSATDEFHKLCIVGESNMLKGGGHFTYSIDYTKLGEMTGNMAADILSGNKKTENIDAITVTDDADLEKLYSPSNLADSGITFIPQTVIDQFNEYIPA